MRLIHTSDWHLGQTFHGFDRHAEHAAFLDWLIGQLEARASDALLIAGDVFDQVNPSAEAQRLFYRFLAEARKRCPQLDIVVIAGNHDSPARMEAPQDILHALGVHVIGQLNGVNRDEDALRIPLRDGDGRIAAWVLAVPFLRPADLPRGAGDVYVQGIADTYRRVVDAALAAREPDQALLAMGHLHVRGGNISALSERALIIGGEEAVSADIFPPQLAYVALGHLHLAQHVGRESVRYCGSPMPLSFAEINYPHQIVEVELQGAELLSSQPISVPRAAQLLRVPARHAPLADVLGQLSALDITESAAGLEPLIEVRVTQDLANTGLRAQVEAALEGKRVRLARIDVQRRQSSDPANAQIDAPKLALEALQPTALFLRLVQQETQQDASESLLQAFGELVELAEGGQG
ncbi:MAG: exonuclease SbcCD subunit D C-terminal domain-containing protein [Dokdonella sp.]